MDDVSPRVAEGWRFGLSNEKVAAALRQLADKIDAGDILVQQTRVIDRATQKDFAARSIILRIVDRS